jgi:biotin carboxyl carrier protein
MTFEIEVNGRVRRVSIEKAGAAAGRFRVALDSQATIVDALRVGEYGVSLVFPDAAHESGEVQLAPGSTPGELLANLGGRTIRLVVNGWRHGRAAGEAAVGAHGEQRVAAPMPGRVVRVLVAEGDAVDVRQPLVVVEAMKMENELRSPRAGRVTHVAIAAGASVDAGAVLVVIE